MSKPVAVNKSNQSTPYYIRGVDLVDFLLFGNKSITIINQVDMMELIENRYIYGNSEPVKSTSGLGITYERNEHGRVLGQVLFLGESRITKAIGTTRLTTPPPLCFGACHQGFQRKSMLVPDRRKNSYNQR